MVVTILIGMSHSKRGDYSMTNLYRLCLRGQAILPIRLALLMALCQYLHISFNSPGDRKKGGYGSTK